MIKIKAEEIEKAFKKYRKFLNIREQEIVTKYYGLNTAVRHSLTELGWLFGVTRERIRQIKTEALKKIMK